MAKGSAVSQKLLVGWVVGVWLVVGAVAPVQLYLSAHQDNASPAVSKKPSSQQDLDRDTLHWMLVDASAEKASRTYENFLAKYPADLEARRDAALFYKKQGNIKQAFAHAKRLVRANPRDVEALILHADLARESNDLSTSLQSYEDAGKLAPKDPRPFKGQTLVYRALGDAEKALRNLELAVSIDKKDQESAKLLKTFRREAAMARAKAPEPSFAGPTQEDFAPRVNVPGLVRVTQDGYPVFEQNVGIDRLPGHSNGIDGIGIPSPQPLMPGIPTHKR